jgi:release factor glutamine methyltransferase
MTREEAVRALRAAGVDNPRLDARVLWDHAQADECRFGKLVARRVRRDPVAYIVGRKDFWNRSFAVGPGVLIPRPETETLVEEVLKVFPGRATALDILDLGTGSGCILAALLSEYPFAQGVGVEASAAACGFARRNLERLPQGRLLFGIWQDVSGRFDVVVANPPYVKTADIGKLEPEVAEFEPAAALDGGVDGLCAYRALATEIPRLLNPGGLAFFEIGAGQAEDVRRIFTEGGLEIARTAADLAGIVRVVVAKRP